MKIIKAFYFKDQELSVLSEAIPVHSGQLEYEWKHLLTKLSNRDRSLYNRFSDLSSPVVHPLFKIISGPIELWEKT